jgi:aspartate aminotransferase
MTPRTKAILLNSPHNPTGAIFSKAALTKLAEALIGSGITMLSDDIYAKLVYDDSFTPVPACGFEKLVIINGFSKSQALTGWRIGYCIASAEVAAAMTRLLSHTMGNASLPAQQAALTALTRHDKPPASTLAALKRQRTLVVDALNSAPGITCPLPGGAFYVFFDIRAITDDSAGWCERLLDETGVALVPGEAFGAPGFVRLTFVADPAVLKPALERIKEFAGAAGKTGKTAA